MRNATALAIAGTWVVTAVWGNREKTGISEVWLTVRHPKDGLEQETNLSNSETLDRQILYLSLMHIHLQGRTRTGKHDSDSP